VFRALTDPYALERWSDGVLDEANALEAIEGDLLRLTLPPRGAEAAATELVFVLRRTPRGTHLASAEYGVSGREESRLWPPMFEWLARFLAQPGSRTGCRWVTGGWPPRGGGSGVRATPLFRRGRLLYSLESSREAARGCFRRPHGSSRVHPSHPHKEAT